MSETNLRITRDVSNGQEITEKSNVRFSKTITQETEKNIVQRSESVVMSETLHELSEEQSNNLKAGSLDSMKLLRQCANQSLKLLETCVSDADIEASKNGGPRVDVYRLDMAVKVANSIATQLQTQNNLLKSLALFTKGK